MSARTAVHDASSTTHRCESCVAGADGLAAIRPRRIVLIEGLGPISRPSAAAAATLARAAMGRQALIQRARRGAKIYPSLDAAIHARFATIATFPGAQTLSREAAAAILRCVWEFRLEIGSRSIRDRLERSLGC